MVAARKIEPGVLQMFLIWLGLSMAIGLLPGCTKTVKEEAAKGSSEPAAIFTGTFQGKLGAAPLTLTLEQQGDQVNGRLAAGQQFSILKGIANGKSARGRLEDTDDNQSGDVELVRDGDSLTMTLKIQDAGLGSSQTVKIALQRAGGSPAAAAATDFRSPKDLTTATAPPADATERDSRLVGYWRHTDSGRSGSFTYAVDTHFAFNEDGTYRYGDSKAGAGDASSTAVANGRKAEVGQWRTENKVLSLRPDGGPTWTSVGRYAVDSTHLMLIYKNGNKKIWERERERQE
jgi:hypothetical protein